MAYNPFKNRKITEPKFSDDPENTTDVSTNTTDVSTNTTKNISNDKDSLVQQPTNFLEASTSVQNDSTQNGSDLQTNTTPTILEAPSEVEVVNISTLNEEISAKPDENSTVEIVENNVNDVKPTEKKEKFDLPLLESISLPFVLEKLGAVKNENNIYQIYDNEISIKENKWYNKTLKTGKANAISLVKHLIAINKKLNEKEQDKMLFFQASQYLNGIKEEAIFNSPKEEVNTPISTENNNQSNTIKQFKSKEEKNAYWKNLTEQLKNIDLALVMEHIGATPNANGHRGKWKVWSTGNNIAVTGQKWNNWNHQDGGYGAISLMCQHISIVNNIDIRNDEQRKVVYRMAIQELIKTFGVGDLDLLAGSSNEIIFKEPFSLPHKIDFKLNQVRKYLHEKRGLPNWIINKQIKAGHLFAGYPSDWKETKYLHDPEKLEDENVWATFLSFHGTAAEMRGIARTDELAKILAKGSDKELGGYILKAEKDVTEKTVATLEAAVDAMSYHAIYPGRITTSCMGVNFNLAVTAATEALDRNYNFQFCFDNDQAGNEAAVRFREKLISEIGQDEYNEHAQAGRIKYFDLGLKCLEESIQQNKIFYLDVQDNVVGKDVVKLFQDQAFKKWDKETIKNWLDTGKLKYLNVCPVFQSMVDPEKEALVAFNKLNSGRPYYLRIKDISDDSESNSKLNLQEKKDAFINELKKVAGDSYSVWEEKGLIINKKIAIAKDWNEYFIYKKNNDLEFSNKLEENEIKYAAYSDFSEEKTSKKKSKM